MSWAQVGIWVGGFVLTFGCGFLLGYLCGFFR
jgi:hypothetical protein